MLYRFYSFFFREFFIPFLLFPFLTLPFLSILSLFTLLFLSLFPFLSLLSFLSLLLTFLSLPFSPASSLHPEPPHSPPGHILIGLNSAVAKLNQLKTLQITSGGARIKHGSSFSFCSPPLKRFSYYDPFSISLSFRLHLVIPFPLALLLVSFGFRRCC